MIKRVPLVLVWLLISLGIVFAESDFSFNFKRNPIFRNSYNLNIFNHSDKTLMFGRYGTENYIAEMNNGSIISLDSKAFNNHYFKGAMWISKGKKGYLPFKIKRDIMDNAKRLIFIGEIAREERTGSFVDYKDRNEYIITVDLMSNNISYEIGKKLKDRPALVTIFMDTDNSKGIRLNDLKDEKSGDEYHLKLDDHVTSSRGSLDLGL